MAPKKPKNKRKNKDSPEDFDDVSAAPSKVESRAAQPESAVRMQQSNVPQSAAGLSIEPITPSIGQETQHAPLLDAMRMIVSGQV